MERKQHTSIYVVLQDGRVFHAIDCEHRETADRLIEQWGRVPDGHYLATAGVCICKQGEQRGFVVEPSVSGMRKRIAELEAQAAA